MYTNRNSVPRGGLPSEKELGGVSNGSIRFESARKIWPLLELLARIRLVLVFATARMLEFSLKFPAVYRFAFAS